MSTTKKAKRAAKTIAATDPADALEAIQHELNLFSYQLAWLRDTSRFKIGLWSRQTGKDYTCALEAVLDCFFREETHWLIVAASERQAVESLAKAAIWAPRVQKYLEKAKVAVALPEPKVSGGKIQFDNGSRITAVPAKPSTIRGYSANLTLSEFAFHEKPEALWRAVFPMITNPLTGGEKRLRIITTPNGQGDFFHRLWRDSNFSRHKVTIQDASAAGLPVQIETLRAGIADPEAWAREYECEFTDRSTVLLPYELIDSCTSRDATETSSLQLLSSLSSELYMGIDFGRHRDLTVCWTLERVGQLLWTREVLVLHRMSTPAQFDLIEPRVRLVRRVCLDATGSGVGLADLLERPHGQKLESCTFTSGLKQEVYPRLRAAFERGLLRIPNSQAIRDDLHGVQKVVSPQGQVSYRATSSPDGHSDRCTALALAVRAAQMNQESSEPTVTGRSRQR